MSWLIIPVTSDPWADFSVSLEGVTYVFEQRWNERAGAWYLDILDQDGNYLATGRKVVSAGTPIVGLRETNPNIFPGRLWGVDTSGQDIAPGPDDFGTRFQLVYEESGT